MRKIPVWVRLYNVPLEYWTVQGLSFVASAIGIPLHADHITLARKRLSFVQVCVEIDASEDLIKEFDLQCPNGEQICVVVDFERLPHKCGLCGVFGHSNGTCPKVAKEKTKQVWVPKIDGGDKVVPKVGSTSEGELQEVTRRKKGKSLVECGVPSTSHCENKG
ncbi:uncharacterized protein LOC120105420 [Phoenix dactylifera]|uniref:Uncharacterized protein LOC120105420 n=1 Tax=Phoenix dactylifera TaxID=42345 RepID=A0A8B8ZQJ3_PHODC|nr:uncharacterized protein LOC120105420 [Phoenix dactylifera]